MKTGKQRRLQRKGIKRMKSDMAFIAVQLLKCCKNDVPSFRVVFGIESKHKKRRDRRATWKPMYYKGLEGDKKGHSELLLMRYLTLWVRRGLSLFKKL